MHRQVLAPLPLWTGSFVIIPLLDVKICWPHYVQSLKYHLEVNASDFIQNIWWFEVHTRQLNSPKLICNFMVQCNAQSAEICTSSTGTSRRWKKLSQINSWDGLRDLASKGFSFNSTCVPFLGLWYLFFEKREKKGTYWKGPKKKDAGYSRYI